MPTTVINIGHANNSANASFTVTVTNGVPAGATIVVGARENTTVVALANGTITDSGGNSYTLATSVSNTAGRTGMWFVQNCKAIAAGGTITFTKVGATTDATTVSAGYIAGIGANDAAATGTAVSNVSATTLTTTSGTPAQAGELFVSFIGIGVSSTSVTNDGAWTSPPLDVAAAINPSVGGGFRTNAGSGTLTYAPSWATASTSTAGIIIGFRPFPSGQLFDWSNPARFRPSAPLILPVSIALLSSLPFAQTDWSKPARLAPPKQDQVSSPLVLLSAAAAVQNQPRAPVLGRSKQLPSLPPSAQGTPAILLQSPVVPTDFSKPLRFALAPQMQFSSPIALLSVTVQNPFAQYDWSKPALLRAAPQVQFPAPAALLAPAVTAAEPRTPVLGGPKQPPNVPPSLQGSPTVLLTTVAVQNPFIPFDWSKPFFPQPARDATQPTNTNLLTNPIPFGPYDYSEGPTSIKFIKPFDQQPNYQNFYPNPVPFGPYDYSKGPFVPKVAKNPPNWSLNINLQTNPIPFGPYDWNKAQKPYPSKQFDQQPNYPSFYPNPIPFGPFDWSKAVDVASVPSHPVTLNIALTTVVIAPPFFNPDFSKPFFVQVRVDQTQPTNVNLFTNPIPIIPFDWSKPFQLPGLPPQPLPVNVALFTAVVVQPPFFNPDFSKPYFRIAAPSFAQAPYANFYPNPIPLGPYDWSGRPQFLPRLPPQPLERNPLIFSEVPTIPVDWSRPLGVRLAPPQAQPYNVLLYSAPFLNVDFTPPRRVTRFLPFAQPYNVVLNTPVGPTPFLNVDWSKPFRLRSAPPQPQPNLTIKLPPPPPAPLIPFDWSRPWAIRPVAPQSQPNLTLYLPPPPALGIPALCYSRDIPVRSISADDLALVVAKSADVAARTVRPDDFAVVSAEAEDLPSVSVKASDSPSGQGWSGAGYMAKYEIDTTIELQGVFTNVLTGVYADPSTITLYILDPTGIKTTQNWPGNIVRDSLGHFHFIMTPNLGGDWTYKWQGFGPVTATSPDTVFTVTGSAFISGGPSLLLETAGFLLLETGSQLLLEH